MSRNWNSVNPPSQRRREEKDVADRRAYQRLVSQGWVPVRRTSIIATVARQLNATLVDLLGPGDPVWVCPWFYAYCELTSGAIIAGVVTNACEVEIDAMRQDVRKQVVMVTEYLLMKPYGDPAAREAMAAWVAEQAEA